MRTATRKAWICGLAAGVAAALGGCAAPPVGGGETVRSELIYSTGRPAPMAENAPIPQVTAQGAAAGGLLDIVYFDFDRYDIQPRYREALEGHARVLRADASARVVVEGHTDQWGSVEYNLALGQRRAEAVRRALRLLGAGDQQLEAVSFGETQPAAEGEDEASRARNRRAEIRRAN